MTRRVLSNAQMPRIETGFAKAAKVSLRKLTVTASTFLGLVPGRTAVPQSSHSRVSRRPLRFVWCIRLGNARDPTQKQIYTAGGPLPNQTPLFRTHSVLEATRCQTVRRSQNLDTNLSEISTKGTEIRALFTQFLCFGTHNPNVS